MKEKVFEKLKAINHRPKPFEVYTAKELWTDDYTSAQMLKYHLNEDIDVSSRNFKFIERSVEWIVSHFNVNETTRIIDFGCGPGLYTSKLARQKANVIGIDFSKRSIEYARKFAKDNNLNIEYINQDYLQFKTDDRFHLITMIMCDFCALSPDQRRKLLKIFHNILAPDGSMLLDVYSLNAYQKRKETSIYEANLLDSFWSPDEYYGFLNTFKYDDEKVILDKYTIIEEIRIKTIYNWLQYFSTDSIEQEFSGCGFKIKEFYSDVAGTPFSSTADEFAIVAAKK